MKDDSVKSDTEQTVMIVGSLRDKPSARRKWIAVALLLVLLAVGVSLAVWQLAADKRTVQPAKKQAAPLAKAEEQNEGGDFQAEAATLQAYLKTNPPKAEADAAIAKLAAAYVNAKAYDKAIETYQLMEARGDPNDPSLTVLRGFAEAYDAKGDKENAIKYYERVIAWLDKHEKKDRRRAYAERRIAQLRAGQ